MKKCECCELMEYLRSEDRPRAAGMHEIQKAAIVDETYKGKTFRGRVTHYGYKLNYCPTCGKKFK